MSKKQRAERRDAFTVSSWIECELGSRVQFESNLQKFDKSSLTLYIMAGTDPSEHSRVIELLEHIELLTLER
ncbi:MAG: hypothetical protein WD529_00195 [Balneolaceae bacterium]